MHSGVFQQPFESKLARGIFDQWQGVSRMHFGELVLKWRTPLEFFILKNIKREMTLEEIKYREDLSVRSYNVCRDADLLDLAAIQDFYQTNNSFKKIRNCGSKSNIELMSICRKYINFMGTAEGTDTWNPLLLSIDDFYSIHFPNKPRFSWETLKFCQKNKLKSIQEILEFFDQSGAVSNPDRIPKAIYEDLKTIHQAYSKRVDNSQKIERIKVLDKIEDDKRTLITLFIPIYARKLSVRAINALNSHLNGNLDFLNFQKRILSNLSFDVFKMANVGVKTAVELQDFINSVEEFGLKVSEIESEQQTGAIRNKLTIQALISGKDIPETVVDSTASLTIVKYLIDHLLIFGDKRGLVFQKGFNIYKDVPALSMEELAGETNLSRERVRQIRVEILDGLIKSFGFVKDLYDPFIDEINIGTDAPALWIEQKLASRINDEYKTQFSIPFLTFLFGIIASDNFAMCGAFSDVLVHNDSRKRSQHNWRGIYLISHQFLDIIEFPRLLDDLESKTSEKIDKTTELDFTDFLKSYIHSNHEHIFEEIAGLVAQIINLEFDTVSVSDGFIHLHKNTTKLAYEYAYEALTELGKPTHADDIARKAMEMNPGYITSAEQMRPAMKRKFGFIPIGRTGVYGLTKWESELETFKGGTIRNMVTEYLKQYEEPIGIDQIAKYVLKYRPKSNQDSIYQNLYLEKHNTFSFYKYSKVGLTSKNYRDHFERLPEEDKQSPKSWESQFQDLEVFLNTKKRLPLSSSDSAHELTLYRWWQKQFMSFNQNKLKNERSWKIAEIITNYYSKGESNHRKPQAKAQGSIVSSSKSPKSEGGQFNLFDDGDF